MQIERTMNLPTSVSNIRELWQPFVRVFQMFCVSHYSIFRPDLRDNRLKSWLFLVYYLIFFAVHLSFIILTGLKSLRCEQKLPESEQRLYKHRESALMYYVNSLSILGGFSTHVISHLETLLCKKHEEEIFMKLNMIENIFATKLNHLVDYKMKRIKYIQQTVGMFVFVTVLAVASSFTNLPDLYHDKYFMQPILIFPVIINRFRWCYMALILHAIADILNDLQTLLKLQQIHSCDESTAQPEHAYAREKIRYFREIYSYVWFIITVLSDCFGWTFIFFLVEFTFEVINASYWLYINLTIYGSIQLNIRN